MNDSQITEEFRRILFSGTDSEFRKYVIELKQSGLKQAKAYEILLEIWSQLDVSHNDRELDILSNWLDEVSGNVIPEYRIWADAIDNKS
jgi:hypothetical protein